MGKSIRQSICIFLAVGLMGGCATTSKQVTSYVEGFYLKDICATNDISWQWDSMSKVVTLEKNQMTAKFLVGSNVVLVGEERIVLNAAIQTVDSLLVVPLDFQQKVISRFAQKKTTEKYESYSLSKVKTVIIDPGHGGKDPGALSPWGLKEKDIVLDICLRLKDLLKKRGFHVIMTRNHDHFISLQKRTELASVSQADIFISVHANSSPAKNVAGVEVYTLKNLGFFEKEDDQININQRRLFQSFLMRKSDNHTQNIVTDMLSARKENESVKLAENILGSFVRILDSKNRGLKTSRFFVLRNTLIPAVLIEVGFLSNKREEKKMRGNVYRQKIAHSIAKGIIDYSSN